MSQLKKSFRPEFLNRIDEIIVFHQLNRDQIQEIAKGMIRIVADRVRDLNIELVVEDSALTLIADEGFDPVYGARPLRRVIQSSIEDTVSERLLDGSIKSGGTVRIYEKDGKLEFESIASSSENKVQDMDEDSSAESSNE